ILTLHFSISEILDDTLLGHFKEPPSDNLVLSGVSTIGLVSDTNWPSDYDMVQCDDPTYAQEFCDEV
ncbi:hypothetical protein DL89DRAFT_268592, partial [Linderina pennispora]